jgi:hypothetical protein
MNGFLARSDWCGRIALPVLRTQVRGGLGVGPKSREAHEVPGALGGIASIGGNRDLARSFRGLGEPTREADIAKVVLWTLACELTTRCDLKCDGLEISSKAGASELRVGLLQRPKLRKCAPAFGRGQTQQGTALPGRAKRFDEVAIDRRERVLGIQAHRGSHRDGDDRECIGMRRAEMDRRQPGGDQRLAVGGATEAPGMGRHRAGHRARQGEAQGDACRAPMIPHPHIPDATNGCAVVYVEHAAAVGKFR